MPLTGYTKSESGIVHFSRMAWLGAVSISRIGYQTSPFISKTIQAFIYFHLYATPLGAGRFGERSFSSFQKSCSLGRILFPTSWMPPTGCGYGTTSPPRGLGWLVSTVDRAHTLCTMGSPLPEALRGRNSFISELRIQENIDCQIVTNETTILDTLSERGQFICPDCLSAQSTCGRASLHFPEGPSSRSAL